MKLFSIRNKYRFLERLMADKRQRLVHYACCRLGNSEDAEDAIQDLFLQFHERMKKTDDNDSLSTDIKNPMAYLYRSLMNLCISKQRSAGRIQMVPLSDKNGENFKTPSFDEEDEMEHEYRRICQLLETIPDEQAEGEEFQGDCRHHRCEPQYRQVKIHVWIRENQARNARFLCIR